MQILDIHENDLLYDEKRNHGNLLMQREEIGI